MTQSKLQIRLAQLNPTVGDIPHNQMLIEQAINEAQTEGIDLIVLPELVLTGYPPEDLLAQPDCQQRWQQAIYAILPSTHEIAVVLGAPYQEGNQLYNAAYYLYQGQVQQIYTKQILPNYGVFDEKRYFTPGSSTNNYLTIKGFHVGIMICEDLWHEAPSETLSQTNLDAIVTINASPYHVNKFQERLSVLQKHCQTCQAAMLYTNLVGGQDDLLFDGRSFIVDNNQQLLSQAQAFTTDHLDCCLSADGLSLINTMTTKSTTDQLAILYEGLTTGIHDYLQKNHFPGAIVGLSGGIDSALTLALAVDALGADHVQAVMMPSVYTSQLSLDLAQEQTQLLGVNYTTLPIDTINQSFLETLTDWLPTQPHIAHENIQARIRGILLMALSNQTNSIVLATGNKSELAVGYATLYGDMVGGFAPLKDVYKTTVYALAHHRNQKDLVIPQGIIDRAPSAELAHDQQDSDSLPPYPILDQILQYFIEKEASLQTIIHQGYDPKLVNQVIRLVLVNEYKRRQAPLGPKTTPKAFQRERRYPVTSGLNQWF